jgi:hypothetical protein
MKMSDELERLSMNDPRIDDECRNSPHVKELLAKGVRPFWDAETSEVRWIKPSDGKLECVVTEGAFEDVATSPRQSMVRKFNKRARRYKSN